MLDAANIARPEDVASYWSGLAVGARAVGAGAALNRDDLPLVEYRAPRDLVGGRPRVAQRRAGGGALVPFEGRIPAGRASRTGSRRLVRRAARATCRAR